MLAALSKMHKIGFELTGWIASVYVYLINSIVISDWCDGVDYALQNE